MVKLPIVWSKCALIKSAALITVAFVSSNISWALAKRKYQAEMDEQVAQIKAYYKEASSKVAEVVAEDVAEAAAEIHIQQLYKVEDDVLSQVKEQHGLGLSQVLADYGARQVTTNQVRVIDPEKDRLDEVEELVSRPGKIIVIEEDDFCSSSDFPEYEKLSCTYYEKDDVLVDGFGDPYDEYAHMLGTEFLTEFKKVGGAQEKMTFVRNHILHTDYEIYLNPSSYSEEVLGIQPERKRKAPLKFRDDD